MLLRTAEAEDRLLAIIADRPPSQWTEPVIRAILAIDPDDLVARVELAHGRIKTGDLKSAEETLWRTAELYPCSWVVYHALSYVTGTDESRRELSMALNALDIFYLSLDEDAAKQRYHAGEFRSIEPLLRKVAGTRKLDPITAVSMLGTALGQALGTEGPEVAERMRGHRLIRSLFVAQALSESRVDEVLAAREIVTPLLVGVLRGFVRNIHRDLTATRNAIALLGEISDLSTLRTIVEVGSIEGEYVEAAAIWAFDRIKSKSGEVFDHAVFEIAATAAPEESMLLMKAVTFHHRHWPASFRILDLLAERFSDYEAADKSLLAPPLVMTLITMKQREGAEQARKLIRENAASLSREVRSRCDLMVAELGSGPFPKLAAPTESEDTIYTICAGEAAMESAGEEDDGGELEDDFEDEFEPVEQRHRPARPGRNDPCWCGSGKKYKKCHLDADEQSVHRSAPAPSQGGLGRSEVQRLQRQLLDFKDRELSSSEQRAIRNALFEPDDREPDQVLLGEWGLHDWVWPRLGRTVLHEYLRRNHGKHTQQEQELLRNWAESYYGLYEVTDVQKGTGLTLKDMTTGEERFVHDVSMSRAAVRWDGMLARVVDGERGHELGGFVLTVPRATLGPFFAWMEKDKRQLRLPWHEYFKTRFPQVRRQLYRLMREGLAGLQLENTDGEVVVISAAAYRIEDINGILAALRAIPEMVEDVAGQRFSWLNSEKTVLGTITIREDRFTFECNSRERLKKGKELLAGIGTGFIQHVQDEFLSQEELKARAAGPQEDTEPALPSETAHQIITEHLKRHYASWPDQKLPALEGRTPREAMLSPVMRPRVVELLRSLENAEERKRQDGEPFFDVRVLQDELGVKDHER